MADMTQIHTFAIKWSDKFRDQDINYIELVDHFMADDCDVLGFEMDCGNAFETKYGKAVYDDRELTKVIDSVDDVNLLGSAIYSRWRYFNHWAYTGAEILDPKNREWFILALGRLALLSGKKSFAFQGELKKMRIVSNGIGYGPCPEPDDIVEQRITINSDGQVWYSGYAFGEGYGKYKKTQTRRFKIAKAIAENVLNKTSAYFSNEYEEIFATDIGNWELELTNTEDKTYKFTGSLCAEFEIDGVDLSDLIRDSLEMDDLYVFDGRFKPDVINRIVVDYHRVTKIISTEPPSNATEYFTWDYTEHLIIDRATETLEHIQNIGTGCKVSRKYEVEGGIESLLDDFDAEGLFAYVEGNSDDVFETPNETKDYKITIDYKKNPQQVITGTFDKNGLPNDYEEFADAIFDFMRFYGLGEILDPAVYRKLKRCHSDYIFCSVAFEEGSKTYYYLTDDDSIEIGDFVIVPVGKDNHEAVVEVVNIEYFSKENAPLPIEKTKNILRKCMDEEI